MIYRNLYIDNVEGKGRGVFTATEIPADTTIEIAPVIVMNRADRHHLDQTLLHDYIFEWTPEGADLCCMALGYVPVYNHSYTSNCEYFMDFDMANITIKTVRDIAANEELTINYNGDWNDERRVWFDIVE
jgi:SET domain-containing protein